MDETVFRKKSYGAWLGKAVGGTLGQPWEGATGPLDLDFYRPVPTEMMPNDDLDLQILWACKLATDWNGVISCENFENAWKNNVAFPYDEYGVAIRNIRLGLHAPLTGSYDNAFIDGLGGAIRSEIWACLAPGDPERAAKMAYLDACVDHAGDGIYTEVFLAVMESLAFVESDIPTLISKALKFIPADSVLAHSISDTVKWCSENRSFTEIRQLIRTNYGSPNFTDVKMNLAFEVAALLLGKGDFGKSICCAVNFGQDTDCTGATVGAILGIIDPDSITEEWQKPIGRNLLLSKEITGIECPPSIDAFAELVISLKDKVTVAELPSPAPQLPAALAITMRESTFGPWFAADYRKFAPVPGSDVRNITVPGNFFTLDFTGQPAETLKMLETDFTLTEKQTVRILVNTPARVMVWLDGKELFCRFGGDFVPAFHRAQANQLAQTELPAGKHTLTIGTAPADEMMKEAPLLFGIAGTDNLWLVDPFRK
ncbi:MAG: ADP-ribosylglycohydrolase family protein [Lentisphaeria bacterium]|nr:ADP-ribosylglycohydrolase family protein [Lentisphaeria bacterium]